MITSDGSLVPDRILTVSNAPGYRDITITMELHRGTLREEVRIVLPPADALLLLGELVQIQRAAWANGRRPLDVAPGELRPTNLIGE